MGRACMKMEKNGFAWICFLVLMAFCARTTASARSEQEMRERFYGNLVNSSAPNNGEGSIAKMFDRVLEKEFQENDQPEGSDGRSFNSSVADQQATIETVVKITHEKTKKNDTPEANGTRPFQIQDMFNIDNEGSDDMTTLIDNKDNVFVMSNKKSKYPVLQVDLRLRPLLSLGLYFFCLH